MNFIHPTFKTTEVLNYIANLITDYDYKDYSDLSFYDKCELASLLIEPEGFEMISFETRESFKQMLCSTLNEENYLFDLRENTVKYYDDIMESLFAYTLEEYVQERNAWLDEIAKYGDSDSFKNSLNEVTL